MDKWNIVLTILISILCGVVANIGTPTITKLFTKGMSGYRSARLRKYKTYLEVILSHRNNTSVATLLLLRDIVQAGLFFFSSVLLLGWAYSLDSQFLKRVWFFPIGAALGALSSGSKYIRYILDPNYTERLARKIKRLEAKVPADKQDDTRTLSN